jgi:hypothetical protein
MQIFRGALEAQTLEAQTLAAQALAEQERTGTGG